VLQVGTVLVEWITGRPYESVVQCSAPGCRLIGLNLSHTSPSVANNYAVYNQVGPPCGLREIQSARQLLHPGVPGCIEPGDLVLHMRTTEYETLQCPS